MAFQVSPGVTFSEVDLSTTIPTASVSDAGFAGAFQKGPAMTIIKVSSEKELYDIFGGPTGEISSNWLTVASFLAYGGDIQIVRTVGNDTKSAIYPADASGTGSFSVLFSTSEVGDWTDSDTVSSIDEISNGDLPSWTVEYVGDANGAIDGTPVATPPVGSADATFTSRVGSTNAVISVAYIAPVDNTGNNDDDVAESNTVSVVHAGTDVLEGTHITSLGDAGTPIDMGTPIITTSATNSVLESGTITSLGASGLAVLKSDNNGVAIVSVVSSSDVTINNQEDFETAGDLTNVQLIATSPGTWGNKIKVEFTTDDKYGSDIDGANENHIVVSLDGEIVETFSYVEMVDTDSKDEQGLSIYYKNVLNTQSAYVWAGGASVTKGSTITLTGGDDGYSTSQNVSNRTSGYDLFDDPEQSDLSLVITGDSSLNDKTTSLATARRDCVAFVSPTLVSVNSNFNQSSKAGSVTSSKPNNKDSYGFMDSGWKKMYDKYNDTWVQVPLNGDTAGLCVATDQSREPWYSPAGFNRGQIRNCAGLLFDPNKTSRDTLYKANVNPVASFPGEGFVLFGDKTLQKKSSAFDRLNVRRLFIVLEKAISGAAEFNDEFTRGQFRSMVAPFLEDVKARRGIYDFLLVCDESNNTPTVVDNNEFVGDIFIKPARSINFIQLNFVAVKTGVSFQEIVGAV